jgi:hypothetical protein
LPSWSKEGLSEPPAVVNGGHPKKGQIYFMNQCAVVECDDEGVIIAGKPTPWGAWEYWVCLTHKADVDAGSNILDNTDGRTITLSSGPETPAR